MDSLEQELLDQLKKLDTAQKQQVLDFARNLARSKGELVSEFLKRTRDIRIPSEDLEIMKRVAEEDEER